MSKKHKEQSLNPFAENSTEIKDENLEQEVQQVSEEHLEQANELQKKYDELNNQYIRLAADFDNYRKRQAQERESLLKYGAEETMKKIIEVLDNFDRGAKAVENIDDCKQVKDSFNLVFNQMKDVLSKMGLEVIEAEGKEFDPNLHEAVMQTPSEEYPENTVINELQKGYKLSDKVLRATLVNVATSV